MEINVNKPTQVQQKTETGWKKEPSISDLKTDLNNSAAAHSAQVSKITKWLDVLNLTGNAKPKTAEGKSKVAPKAHGLHFAGWIALFSFSRSILIKYRLIQCESSYLGGY